MWPHLAWSMQAAALLSENEVKVLLGAMAGLWATVVLLATALWRIGARWVTRVNEKIETFEREFPRMLSKAIADHEVQDQARHLEQIRAIGRNADAFTAPWAEMQVNHAVLVERVSALEDTDRTDHRPRGKR